MHQWCLGGCMLCTMISPQSPYLLRQWANTLHATLICSTPPPALHIYPSSFRWPPQSAPPRALWAPAWSTVLIFQHSAAQCPMAPKTALVILSWVPRSTFTLRAAPRMPAWSFGPWIGGCPALMNVIWCLGGWWHYRWNRQLLSALGGVANSSDPTPSALG